jgi:hypothetical protein
MKTNFVIQITVIKFRSPGRKINLPQKVGRYNFHTVHISILHLLLKKLNISIGVLCLSSVLTSFLSRGLTAWIAMIRPLSCPIVYPSKLLSTVSTETDSI